jgi:hypothetical protein
MPTPVLPDARLDGRSAATKQSHRRNETVAAMHPIIVPAAAGHLARHSGSFLGIMEVDFMVRANFGIELSDLFSRPAAHLGHWMALFPSF